MSTLLYSLSSESYIWNLSHPNEFRRWPAMPTMTHPWDLIPAATTLLPFKSSPILSARSACTGPHRVRPATSQSQAELRRRAQYALSRPECTRPLTCTIQNGLFSCKDYSRIWTCDNCTVAYKRWMCSALYRKCNTLIACKFFFVVSSQSPTPPQIKRSPPPPPQPFGCGHPGFAALIISPLSNFSTSRLVIALDR